MDHTAKLYEACFAASAAPTAEQIAAFKPLLNEFMAEFAKLPADV
jgi:hypothetical protein